MVAVPRIRRSGGAAGRLVALVEGFLGCPLPIGLRAWDGSVSGASGPGVPIAVVSRRALRQLLWRPGELGLARAYVAGDIDVDGDLADGLRRIWNTVRTVRAAGIHPSRSPRDLLGAAATVARLGAIGPRPRRPASESRLDGRLHSHRRDRAAIAHHYDLSNAFYQLILDPQMAYSCAFWTRTDPGYTLEDAQRDKLDLICRKLGLQPGHRLLDVGCGWGSLTLHAAQHYGVTVTGVTLSTEQQHYVEQRAKELGVEHLVDVRLQHYADLEATDVHAMASVEMGEHVGDAEYVEFAASIEHWLRPGGRALIQQMSRANVRPGGGPFIETYVAPDMHMKPLPQTLGLLAGAGLEIRDVQVMREHYPRTVAAWARALEDQWDQAVALIGEEQARVWRLYLAGGALAFEQNRMGVDQILLVKPTGCGDAQMPASPVEWLSPPGGAP